MIRRHIVRELTKRAQFKVRILHNSAALGRKEKDVNGSVIREKGHRLYFVTSTVHISKVPTIERKVEAVDSVDAHEEIYCYGCLFKHHFENNFINLLIHVLFFPTVAFAWKFYSSLFFYFKCHIFNNLSQYFINRKLDLFLI